MDLSSTAAVEKTKSLVQKVQLLTLQSSALQITNVTLGKADGYRLRSVQMATGFGAYSSTNAIDITSRYTFDTGHA